MKTLQQLLVQLKPLQIAGSLELSIGAIEIDSRKVKGGYCVYCHHWCAN
jgi:hypothetical protein